MAGGLSTKYCLGNTWTRSPTSNFHDYTVGVLFPQLLLLCQELHGVFGNGTRYRNEAIIKSLDLIKFTAPPFRVWYMIFYDFVVTVRLRHLQGDKFKGYLIQARKFDSFNYIAQGKMTGPPIYFSPICGTTGVSLIVIKLMKNLARIILNVKLLCPWNWTCKSHPQRCKIVMM